LATPLIIACGSAFRAKYSRSVVTDAAREAIQLPATTKQARRSSSSLELRRAHHLSATAEVRSAAAPRVARTGVAARLG
jgi:hypothetical protein